jgi:hypothetical protein
MAPSSEKKKVSFCQNFKTHLTPNRALLPLKLVMFLFYGGWFFFLHFNLITNTQLKRNYFLIEFSGATIFLPYVTLHMLQVGITVQEVGVIYAILPFAACFGPPTAGKQIFLPILLCFIMRLVSLFVILIIVLGTCR